MCLNVEIFEFTTEMEKDHISKYYQKILPKKKLFYFSLSCEKRKQTNSLQIRKKNKQKPDGYLMVIFFCSPVLFTGGALFYLCVF